MGPEDHGPLSRDVCFGGKFGPDLLSKSLSAFEPGCVKTHTSAKCRKNNSPTRYRAESAQDDLAPLCAISPRCFYVRGARWSFHTAKTHTGLHLQCRPAAPVAGQSVGLASRQERKRQLPGLLGKASTAFAR